MSRRRQRKPSLQGYRSQLTLLREGIRGQFQARGRTSIPIHDLGASLVRCSTTVHLAIGGEGHTPEMSCWAVVGQQEGPTVCVGPSVSREPALVLAEREGVPSVFDSLPLRLRRRFCANPPGRTNSWHAAHPLGQSTGLPQRAATCQEFSDFDSLPRLSECRKPTPGSARRGRGGPGVCRPAATAPARNPRTALAEREGVEPPDALRHLQISSLAR